MTPGMLTDHPALKPLARISPSHYEGLLECRLREVWAASRMPRLLPLAPAAELGSIVHKLLEEAGSGCFAGEHLDLAIQRRWDELVTEAEGRMRTSWLDARFVPLRKAIPDYDVRRLRALAKTSELAAAEPDSHYSVQGAANETRGTELWVSTDDGAVGGYLDYVGVTGEGVVIRDYKSGEILEGKYGDNPEAIKHSYQTQLKIYAALYACQTGQWPGKLQLVPLRGKTVDVQFDPDSCLELLASARRLRQETNSDISSYRTDVEKAEQVLSSPNPKTCRFCSYRPACAAYQKAREVGDNDDWPRDITGRVKNVHRAGNGRVSLVLQRGEPDKGGGADYTVLALDPDPERHPALNLLREGDLAGLFNLAPAGKPEVFTEHALTTIYKLPGND